jgi:hypothetical protein
MYYQRYLNFETLLKIIIAIPSIALAFFVTYIVYLVVNRNTETIVNLVTPHLITVIVWGVVISVITVFAMVIWGVYKLGRRTF